MPPTVTLKLPSKTGKNHVVTQAVKIIDQHGSVSHHSLNVKIRLPPAALRNLSVDDSDLSSLDYELNQALKHDFEDQKDQEANTPQYNVSFTYKSPLKSSSSRQTDMLTPSTSSANTTQSDHINLQQSTPSSLVLQEENKVMEDPTRIAAHDDKESHINKDTHSSTHSAHSAHSTHSTHSAHSAHSAHSTHNSTPSNDTNPHNINPSNNIHSPSNAPEPNYRTIPPNLNMILKREFGLLNETAEELNMIEKIIFTLRDPLSATKIRLPVKAIVCSHFECFDFDNFCLFNRLPTGIKNVLRKDLIKKSNDLKKRDKILTSKNQDLDKLDVYSLTKSFIYQPNFNTLANLSQNYPMYKCPICNRSFELNQLFISDIFNYFIKTTPKDIDRIELRDMIKYRIVDEDTNRRSNHKSSKASQEPEEVIILSGDEEDDGEDGRGGTEKERETNDDVKLEPKTNGHFSGNDFMDNYDSDDTEDEEFLQRRRMFSDFGSDDSFDQAYRRFQSQNPISSHQSQGDAYTGSGSWEDPVTLD